MSPRFILALGVVLGSTACSVTMDSSATDSSPAELASARQAITGGAIDHEQNAEKLPPQLTRLAAQASDAFGKLSKLSSTISSVISAVDAAEAVLKILGFLPEDDAAEQALITDFHNRLDDLGVALSQQQLTSARDKRLSDMRSDVNEVHRAVKKSGGVPIDSSLFSPFEIVQIGDAIEDSQHAAQNAGDESNFRRYFKESLTDGDWKNLVFNRPGCSLGVGPCSNDYLGSGFVFDWRLGTAEFLRLIASRIEILVVSEPDFSETGYRDEELSQYRVRLGELYDEMMSGIQCNSHRGPVTDVVCADVYTGYAISTQLDEPSCNVSGSPLCQPRIDAETARLTRKVMTKMPLFDVRHMIDTLSVLLDPDFDLTSSHRIRLNSDGDRQCLAQSFVGVWADNPDDPYNPTLQSDLWSTKVASCALDLNQDFAYQREDKHVVNAFGACLAAGRFELGTNLVVRPCTGEPGENWTYDPLSGVLENDFHSVLAAPVPFTTNAPSSETRGAGPRQSWQPYAIPRPTRSLLWQNSQTGELSTWVLDTFGAVTDARSLSQSCSAALGCPYGNVVGTFDLNRDGNVDVLWHNPNTGHVNVWLLDEHGNVQGERKLSWECGPECSQEWSVISTLDVNHDEQTDVLWQNRVTGYISSWVLDKHGTVIGEQGLSQQCDEGCSRTRSAVASLDLDGDGNTDLLWHDTTHGDLTAWLLDHGQVTNTKSLSAWCGPWDGCSQSTRVIGAADFNGDLTDDVLLYNADSGEVSSWLTDGNGTVIGEQSANWQCDSASGCASVWHPVGLVSVR